MSRYFSLQTKRKQGCGSKSSHHTRMLRNSPPDGFVYLRRRLISGQPPNVPVGDWWVVTHPTIAQPIWGTSIPKPDGIAGIPSSDFSKALFRTPGLFDKSPLYPINHRSMWTVRYHTIRIAIGQSQLTVINSPIYLNRGSGPSRRINPTIYLKISRAKQSLRRQNQ